MDQLEEIKSRLDIVSFISEYITLSRAGRNFRSVCPFHKEKTPSFVVSPELQIWHCFGACGEGGDAFKFLMKIEGIEFPEAVRILAERTGVKLQTRGLQTSEREGFYEINAQAAKFYSYILKSHAQGAPARTYLKNERGLEDSTIDQFGIGFAPADSQVLQKFLINQKKYKVEDLIKCGLVVVTQGKRIIDRFHGRVIFPLRDVRGNVLGFSGRLLPEAGPPSSKDFGGASKYVNTPETPIYHKRNHLFGIDVTRETIKEKGEVVVVEGEFDLLSSWQRGIRNIVAIKGSAFTEEQARLISRFAEKIVLALDMDEAGLEATKSGLRIAENEGLHVRIADLGSFKDPDEAVRADKEGFEHKISNALDAYDYFIEKIFQKYNSRTSEGVRKISQELVPLLASVQDEILKAHYARKVSERLGVSQDVVLLQMNRSRPMQRFSKESTPMPDQKKTRRDILEEQVISLALSVRPEFLLDSRFDMLISAPVLIRIRDEAISSLEKSEEFVAGDFIKSLPPELTDRAVSLLLDPKNVDMDLSKKLAELDRLVGELESLILHTRINELTLLIRQKEDKKLSIEYEREELARLVASLSRTSH